MIVKYIVPRDDKLYETELMQDRIPNKGEHVIFCNNDKEEKFIVKQVTTIFMLDDVEVRFTVHLNFISEEVFTLLSFERDTNDNNKK